MPLWLLVYRFLISDLHEEISLPFYQLGGTLVAICLPLITGALIQRYMDRLSRRLDPGIHTTCLCLSLAVFTVGVYSIWKVWSLVTLNLVIAAFALPLAGCLAGVVVMLPMKRTTSVSATKNIVSMNALQNTLLAALVQYSSYPSAQASVMHAGIVCFELASLCLMYVLYTLHVLLWFSVPSYRSMHDTTLIQGGKRPSIADQIVRNMIKAGEISFKKHDPRVPSSGHDGRDLSPDSERSASGSDDGPASGYNSSLATTGTRGFGFVDIERDTLDTASTENVSHHESSELSATGGDTRDCMIPDRSGSSDISADDILKLGVTSGENIDLCTINNRQAAALNVKYNITEKIGKFEFVKHRTNTT